MKILVANLGSTSFKYRLFDMDSQRQLARGGIERIGSPESRCTVQIGEHKQDLTVKAADHVEAVHHCLAQLTDPGARTVCRDASEVVGHRLQDGPRRPLQRRAAGHARRAGGDGGDVRRGPGAQSALHRGHAPAGREAAANSAGGRFRDRFPSPRSRSTTASTPFPTNGPSRPRVRRWGFHGASHRYIAGRTAELLGRADLRIISCHLGGSSSLCAIRNGQSVATTMGMSPQSGLPQNNRVGDFDVFALPRDHGADRQVAARKCCRSWPTRAVCWASAA